VGTDVTSQRQSSAAQEPFLARVGLAFAHWSERWFPDALVFALLGVVLVFGLGLLLGEKPAALALQGGKGFWGLVPFTMQMVMVVIGGYVVASTPVVYALIRRVATWPRSPRAAIALIAFFALLTSLVSWGLSMVFSGILTREMAARVKGMDYRAAGAAAYLGTGSVWALGLSSSAALLMATKSAIPPALLSISGVIPLTQTLFLWQNLLMAVVLIVVTVALAYLSAPQAHNARTVDQFDVPAQRLDVTLEPRGKPGEWLEYSPLLTLCLVALLGWYLIDVFRTSPQGPLAALDLNTYNLLFITAGLLLHWRPKRFLRAVTEAIPATGGVLIQFPFYAMIFGMISGTSISSRLAEIFARITTPGDYPLLVAAYSALLGLFIPSGGSKWIVEAPYVLQAANLQHVHLGFVVQIYNAAEALPNLINPFWLLPLAGILRVKARDLVGYGFLQLLVHVPVVFFLCWALARTLTYLPPG
jgi:short-chain fatty acids transporter